MAGQLFERSDVFVFDNFWEGVERRKSQHASMSIRQLSNIWQKNLNKMQFFEYWFLYLEATSGDLPNKTQFEFRLFLLFVEVVKHVDRWDIIMVSQFRTSLWFLKKGHLLFLGLQLATLKKKSRHYIKPWMDIFVLAIVVLLCIASWKFPWISWKKNIHQTLWSVNTWTKWTAKSKAMGSWGPTSPNARSSPKK